MDEDNAASERDRRLDVIERTEELEACNGSLLSDR
jgi:hypothetical protein